MIETEKFYLFDVGVSNYLAKKTPKTGTQEFGLSFEHLILMELMAYQAYKNPELGIYYWRTSTQQEVDFIINDKELAIEVKGSARVHSGDIKGLKALLDDGPVKKALLVCLEKEPRYITKDIQIMPFKMFLQQLWDGVYF